MQPTLTQVASDIWRIQKSYAEGMQYDPYPEYSGYWYMEGAQRDALQVLSTCGMTWAQFRDDVTSRTSAKTFWQLFGFTDLLMFEQTAIN